MKKSNMMIIVCSGIYFFFMIVFTAVAWLDLGLGLFMILVPALGIIGYVVYKEVYMRPERIEKRLMHKKDFLKIVEEIRTIPSEQFEIKKSPLNVVYPVNVGQRSEGKARSPYYIAQLSDNKNNLHFILVKRIDFKAKDFVHFFIRDIGGEAIEKAKKDLLWIANENADYPRIERIEEVEQEKDGKKIIKRVYRPITGEAKFWAGEMEGFE